MRYIVPRRVNSAWLLAMTLRNIVSGVACTGMLPLNVDMSPASKLGRRALTYRQLLTSNSVQGLAVAAPLSVHVNTLP